MKIGFDAKRAFSNRAGLGNFSRNTIQALCRFYPQNEYFLFTPDTKQDMFSPPANSMIRIPQNIVWKALKPVWRRYHISKIINREKIDIYHGLSHELPVGIEKTDVKSIVTIHDLIFIRYPEYYRAADRRIYMQKFVHACTMADRIHAISHQTKNDIVEFFNISERKIEVIYQSCNPLFYERFSEEEKAETFKKYNLPDFFLLSVGTVEKRKNLMNVLDTMVKYKIDVPLVVAGRKTGYMYEIDDFIQKNKKRLNVYFLEGTSDRELGALYQSAEMLVYPSVFEGFGLPVIEAQASGCPVVTSRSASMPEAGGEGAVYVNPVSSEEIADAILKILSEGEYRQAMIEQGHRNAGRFTPELFTQQMDKLYTRIYNV
ncbi:MAG: glycosyltransferase family 1 protein [Prolixibacteraceae bacterium]|jgi:glycosyltransferase involved in cell wall biosynthesis|nr:glycosyltransferase family 1 protein [Prolixibacteraceae bacterium]